MKKMLPVFCLFIAICSRAQDVQRQNATYSPLETIITDLNADTVNDTISLYETPVAGDPGKFRKMNVSVNGRRMTFFAKDAWISIDDDPFVKENNNAVKSNLAYVYKEKGQSFVILFGRATPGGREEVFILRVKDRKMEIVFHNSIEEPQFFTDLNNDGHVELIAWALPEFRANEKGEAISIYTPYRVYSLTPFFDIDKDLTEKYNKEHYVWAGLQYNKAIEVLYPNDGSKPKLIKTN